MKYRYSFLMFLAATLLQGTALNCIAVFNITPNLLLCLVVMFSFLYHNEFHGMIWGALFGLVSDIMFQQYAGVSALGYFIIALAVTCGSYFFNREHLAAAAANITVATILFNIYQFIMSYFLDAAPGIGILLKRMPMMVIYNAVMFVALYQIFIRRVVRFRNDRYYSSRYY